MDGGEPDIPIYKVIECTGPTNTRVYKVAVYFRGKRLASSTGHSIQQAEMEAAKKALENSSELFPQLDYQKRVMAHSIKKQKGSEYSCDRKRNDPKFGRKLANDESNLPKQYRVRDDKSSTSNFSNVSDSDSHSDSDSNSSSFSDESHKSRQSRQQRKTEQHAEVNEEDKNQFGSLADEDKYYSDKYREVSKDTKTTESNETCKSFDSECDRLSNVSLESGEIS